MIIIYPKIYYDEITGFTWFNVGPTIGLTSSIQKNNEEKQCFLPEQQISCNEENKKLEYKFFETKIRRLFT